MVLHINSQRLCSTMALHNISKEWVVATQLASHNMANYRPKSGFADGHGILKRI